MNALLRATLLWCGAALVLSSLGPVRRPTLRTRLRPYLGVRPTSEGVPIRRRLAPLTLVVGERLGRVMRATEPLERRLRRVHHPMDPGAFRFRQLSQAVAGLGLAGALAAVSPTSIHPLVTFVFVLGTPIAVFAAHEHLLAELERRQTRQVTRELPTVAEQLGMLLASGRSVGAAITHLGTRGRGPLADDLRRVTRRVQQGVDERAALREWADLRPAPGIAHLVGVLTLAGETTDLDQLVEQESDAIRAEAHRELLADLERRSQQVWVPVTVATLLPGSLLLLVPFLDALRLFAGA
jgi:Flp pilus assembly protein TadB